MPHQHIYPWKLRISWKLVLYLPIKDTKLTKVIPSGFSYRLEIYNDPSFVSCTDKGYKNQLYFNICLPFCFRWRFSGALEWPQKPTIIPLPRFPSRGVPQPPVSSLSARTLQQYRALTSLVFSKVLFLHSPCVCYDECTMKMWNWLIHFDLTGCILLVADLLTSECFDVSVHVIQSFGFDLLHIQVWHLGVSIAMDLAAWCPANTCWYFSLRGQQWMYFFGAPRHNIG